MVIALDAMGGDFSPRVPVAGALAALDAYEDLKIILVGRRADVHAELVTSGRQDDPRITIEDAPDVIQMTDLPAKVIRSKPRSSLLCAVDLHKTGAADAIVSAGHTGVQMAASFMKLGLIEGVRRPTIGGLFPSGQNRYSILLDVGANTDCKPINLLQFAVMGCIYMEIMWNTRNPKVGLVSIGAEKNKGNELVLSSHYLLENSGLNFIGNIEGGEIFSGKADVIVCDGFVGNIVLKLTESIAHTIMGRFSQANGADGQQQNSNSSEFAALKKQFDYSEVGGVPLLGVDGLSIICHGGSSAKAIKNALREARQLSAGNLAQALSNGIERYDAGVVARGVARFKGFHDKQDELEVGEDEDD